MLPDIKLGQEYPYERVITEEAIRAFSALSEDEGDHHINPRRTWPFDRPRAADGLSSHQGGRHAQLHGQDHALRFHQARLFRRQAHMPWKSDLYP